MPGQMFRLRGVVVAVMLVGCTHHTMPPASTVQSAAVYWLATKEDSGRVRFLHRARRILLQVTTQPDSVDAPTIVRRLPAVTSTLALVAAQALAVVQQLTRVPPGLPAPTVLMPRDSLVAALHRRPSRWAMLRSRWLGPTICMSLTAPAYSADSTLAVIGVNAEREPLDGEGYWLLLKRTHLGWIVTASGLTWIA